MTVLSLPLTWCKPSPSNHQVKGGISPNPLWFSLCSAITTSVVIGLSRGSSTSPATCPWRLMVTAEAQKGQYLLCLPQISHINLQNEHVVGAAFIFPSSPLCCRSLMGGFCRVAVGSLNLTLLPWAKRWNLTVLEPGQSHVFYPDHAGTLTDNLQSTECGR